MFSATSPLHPTQNKKNMFSPRPNINILLYFISLLHGLASRNFDKHVSLPSLRCPVLISNPPPDGTDQISQHHLIQQNASWPNALLWGDHFLG